MKLCVDKIEEIVSEYGQLRGDMMRGNPSEVTKIYLDDTRSLPNWEDARLWQRVTTAEDAISLLEQGNVTEVSLDHDLGEGATGYDVLLWIEEKVYNDPSYIPPIIHIHTANPVARKKMVLCVEKIKSIAYERIQPMVGFSNRDKARQPRLGKHWCMGCDAAIIGDGERCPICGTKSLPRRYKK